MPSPLTRKSYSSSNRPQEDIAEALGERYQSFGNNSSSPAHRALALYASEHFSCSISTRLFFSAYNAEDNYKYTLEAQPGQSGEINTNSKRQPQAELSGKPMKIAVGSRLLNNSDTLTRTGSLAGSPADSYSKT